MRPRGIWPLTFEKCLISQHTTTQACIVHSCIQGEKLQAISAIWETSSFPCHSWPCHRLLNLPWMFRDIKVICLPTIRVTVLEKSRSLLLNVTHMDISTLPFYWYWLRRRENFSKVHILLFDSFTYNHIISDFVIYESLHLY